MKLERIIAVRTTKTVFRDGDRCIKQFGPEHSKAKILAEAAVHAKIEETGLPVPAILEVTKAEGKWAIVTEYITGKTLDRLMEEEPQNRDALMERFIKAHVMIGAAGGRGLPKLKELLEEHIKGAGLSGAALYELMMRMASLSDGASVCHGDFAPSNLIVNEKGAYITDWRRAAQGPAAADAARTYLLFWLAGDIDGADAYIDGYCRMSGTDRTEIEKWIPLRAAERLALKRPEEREFLLYWVNVVDYE